VGFAVHNATEGFGILSPMVRQGSVVPWGTLLSLGAIGGGPTFVGTMVGSLWTSIPLSVFVLSLAAGALLYVLKNL
jgi:zinc transporter ZupT